MLWWQLNAGWHVCGCCSAGFGQMLARPLFRERHRPDMSEEEATQLLHEGLRVPILSPTHSACIGMLPFFAVLEGRRAQGMPCASHLWARAAGHFCVEGIACMCAGVLLQGQADDKQVPDRQGHQGWSVGVRTLCHPDKVGLPGNAPLPPSLSSCTGGVLCLNRRCLLVLKRWTACGAQAFVDPAATAVGTW